MLSISVNLDVPGHSGAPANFIYELPDSIGIRHDVNNDLQFYSTAGISLPYVTLNNCFADGLEIKRAFIEPLDTIHCVSNNHANFITVVGNESFEILGASEPLPCMKPIGYTGVCANPDYIYRAQIENGCSALLKRDLLSNGFRFKAMGMWYGIVNDITVSSEQPAQQFHQDRVYGFVIDAGNTIYAINETGTIY